VTAVSVPGYEILDPLGRGGFGVVYRARQVTIDREVAIKVDTRIILDERDQRRFLREVRAAGRLSGHPHVVELYDAGVLPDSRPYLVMELCPGGSLADLLADRGPMPVREVVDAGQKIADALAAAHDLGVLHRDIKPGNILVKRYGTVGLADFGLAAVVEAGRDSSVTLAALTPAYAAPEAFHLFPPTVESDVYALTATLYTLITGYPPRFPAEGDLSVPEIIRRHDEPVGDIPGLAPELMAILRRGLAKDPAHRYPEAAALGADLSRLTSGDVSGPRHAVTMPVTTRAVPRPANPAAPSEPSASPPNPASPAQPLGSPSQLASPSQPPGPSQLPARSPRSPGAVPTPAGGLPQSPPAQGWAQTPGGGLPQSPDRSPRPVPGRVQTPGAGLPQVQPPHPRHPSAPGAGHSPGALWTPGAGLPQAQLPGHGSAPPRGAGLPRSQPSGLGSAPGSAQTPGPGLPHAQPLAHGSGPPPGSGAPSRDTTDPGRPRRNPVIVAGAALVAALVLLAAVWFIAFRDTDTGADSGGREPADAGSADASQAAADTRRYGVPTVTEDCPAAAVSDARARCTKRAQCWSAIVLIEGQLTGIRELPCQEGHVYETFAIADIPPGIVDPYQDKLAADPSVKQVCAQDTMLASRYGEAAKYGPERWSVEVLPPTPDDRQQGREIYRCVATLTGFEGLTGSVFRPR
jgi:serine/threonine protein kinase